MTTDRWPVARMDRGTAEAEARGEVISYRMFDRWVTYACGGYYEGRRLSPVDVRMFNDPRIISERTAAKEVGRLKEYDAAFRKGS